MNQEISKRLPEALVDERSLELDQLIRLTIELQTGRDEPILLPIAINGLALLANHTQRTNN